MRLMILTDAMVVKTKPTAYGKVAFNIFKGIKDRHQVAHQPMLGANKLGLFTHDGLLVYPSGDMEFGEDTLERNCLHLNADAVLTLKDLYVFTKIMQQPLEWIPYCPIDHSPISPGIVERLKYAFKVVSMSEFGYKELKKEGVESTLIPHGVGDEYKMLEDRALCRRRFHIQPDEFVIGFVGLNRMRKMIPRVIQVIAAVRHMNPDVKVTGFLWTDIDKEVPLKPIILSHGMNEYIHWPNPEMYRQGIPENLMVELYNAFDCSLCVLPDTHIKSNPSVKPISEISVGDKVLTHSGTYERVNRVFKKNYDGEVLEISTLYNTIPVRLTTDHLVLAIKKRIPNPRLETYKEAMKLRKKGLGNRRIAKKLNISEGVVSSWLYRGFKPIKWRNQVDYYHKRKGIKVKPSWHFAEELEKGDVLLYPIIKEKDIETFKISDYVKNIIVKDEYVHAQGRNQFGSTFIHPRSKPIKNTQKIDETLLRIFGYYVAEGTPSADQVIFSFGTFEQEYIEEVKRLMKQKFGLEAGITNNSRNRTRVVFSSSILARLFRSLFGDNARNKRLPDWLVRLSTKKLPDFIETLWKGDGHKHQYTTVSELLAHQIFDILLRIGILPSISHLTRGEYIISVNDQRTRKRFKTITSLDIDIDPNKKTHKHGWLSKEFAFMPIRSIKKEEYKGPVLDLEIPTSDTFVSSFILHNCVGNEGFWMPGIESLATGTPIVAPDYAAAADRVGRGCGYKVKIKDWTYNNPVGVRQPIVDVMDAARKITKIINGDREKIAKRCLSEAKKYRWSKIIEEKWLPFLEDCETELLPLYRNGELMKWDKVIG